MASVAGKAEPDVSMTMRSGFMSAESVARASDSCPTRLQHMQPLRSSWTPEMAEDVASWESTATSPYSFLRRASLYVGGSWGMRFRMSALEC
jgi:hypothetical protein